MLRSEESETAEPQKESLREASWGHPRERTSVAVSESAQQKDYDFVSICPLLKQARDKRGEGATYQIQLPQPLCSVRQVYNSIIRQIRAISQNQSFQLCELVDTPVLEAAICDRCAACKIDGL